MNGNTMKNKIDCWKTTDSWNLKPLRSSRGNRVLIENRSESKVLGVINGNVELVENQRGQSWFKGEPNNQGYFSLTHPGSEKALTATADGSLEIKGRNFINLILFFILH